MSSRRAKSRDYLSRRSDGQPAYYELIWELVRLCPRGRVTTYGALADALSLGTPRMAGYAMRHSFHADIEVPAHRVVGAGGRLTGAKAFPTPTMMQELLTAEGVEVRNGRVVNFNGLFWHPAES